MDGLNVAEVETILTDPAQHAIVLKPLHDKAPRASDPGDQMLRDTLAVRADLRLVTGDRLLLEDSGMADCVTTQCESVCGI